MRFRDKIRNSLRRMTVTPFEVAIAALLVLSGVSEMLKFGAVDPIATLLPGWEAKILYISSIISGAGIILGFVVNNTKTELAGLWVLLGVIVSRFILYGHFFGYGETFFQTGLFDLSIIVAALVRMNSIRKHHSIFLAKDLDSGTKL